MTPRFRFFSSDDTDDADDSSEDDSKKKRKKRAAVKSLEVVQDDLPSKHKSNVEKKSIQWSSIFGLDRKKKSSGLIFHPLENVDKRKKKSESKGPSEDPEDYGECLDRFVDFNLIHFF
jgi:hypothetical protein